MKTGLLELFLVFACSLVINAASIKDIEAYLEKLEDENEMYNTRKQLEDIYNAKRGGLDNPANDTAYDILDYKFNECEGKDEPFPCKSVQQCIALKFVCDKNPDCEDGYDEDPEMCMAFQRPAVPELEAFLSQEKYWIMGKLFANKPIAKVATALVVSRSVDDFRRRVGMSLAESDNLITVLKATRRGNKSALQKMGMKSASWGDVQEIFGKLIKTGFRP